MQRWTYFNGVKCQQFFFCFSNKLSTNYYHIILIPSKASTAPFGHKSQVIQISIVAQYFHSFFSHFQKEERILVIICHISSRNTIMSPLKRSIQWFFSRVMGRKEEADIIIFNTMTEIESLASQSKKASCQVAKFHYHLTTTIPELFQDPKNNPSSELAPILRCKKGTRNMNFYFAQHNAEGVSSLDAQAILESAMKLYITSECVRVNANSFRKSKEYKVPYLPVYGRFHEIIEFHLVDKNEGGSLVRSRVRARNASTYKAKEVEDETGLTKQPPKIKLPNNFELYVVHHCHLDPKQEGNQMRWESFIQRYRFVEETEDDEVKHRMHYSLMLSYEEEESVFGYFTSHHKLYDAFLADYFTETQGSIQHLDKMQGFLMQSKERVDRKLKVLNDPSHQESHKRWLKLPSQYYKQFTTLKKHTQSYYNSIHPEPKHQESTINNLICRYMHAKQYNYTQTLESVMEYLKWEKEISESYTLQTFADIHKLDFYTYLGQDFEGRTVLLNKAANIVVDKIKDVDTYCLYHIYYLEIWLQRKFAGYADQYTVIADLQGLSSQNFKLSITKRNLSDCLKYCPQRQHRMIVVNVSTFANLLWGVLKPLLPKRTISKLSIVGSEKNQILELLTKEMDITVIPEYLGGKNTRTFNDDLNDKDEVAPINPH